MHDDPRLYPLLPTKEIDSDHQFILESVPEGSRYRMAWEYVLTHELTDREGSAFWHAVSIMDRSPAAEARAL